MVTRSVIRSCDTAAAKSKAAPNVANGSVRNTYANNEIDSSMQADMLPGCSLKYCKSKGGDGESPKEVIAKKRDVPTEELTSNKGQKKRKSSNSFTIDLSDVPPQSPIPKDKSDGRMKNRASKFSGVSWNKQQKKWIAHVFIEGKNRHIGIYDNEEEAGIDYARAVYKYNGKEALDKARVKASQIKLNLSDVPSISPILKSGKRVTDVSSRYVGVSFDKRGKKWMSRIRVEGKHSFIGYYESEEKAAVDYARALLKYRGQDAVDDARKHAAQC